MAIRTINHPDVEIQELDRSQVAPAIVGTSVLALGFANNGEAYNPVELASVSDLETNFGQPTNEAERYFYYTCAEALKENGNVIAIKLPYANAAESQYKYIGLTHPGSASAWTAYTGNTSYANAASAYLVSGFLPMAINTGTLTNTQYDNLKTATSYPGVADYVITCENKQLLGGLNQNEGLFVAVVDPIDGLAVQRVIGSSDSDPMDALTGITLNNTQFVTALSGTFGGTSVSEQLMRYFPTVEFTNNGTALDTYRMDNIAVVVCKTVVDTNFDGKLTVIPLEAYAGSLQLSALDPATGESTYIGNIINQSSQYITFYAGKATTQSNAFPTGTVVSVPSTDIKLLGFTKSEMNKNIAGASIPAQMDIAFDKVSNILEYQIDVVVDAGLSTIAQFCNGVSAEFNPLSANLAITASTDVDAWRSVIEKQRDFCQNIRKDCMAIVDVPRNLVLSKDQKKIRKTAPENTFSNQIGPVLKFLTGINSSYVAVYSNWVRVLDQFSGLNFWLPETAKVGAIYVRNDRVGNIWDAPAGLNRGIIYGINDIAYNPKDKEADQLYSKSFNYAKFYPLDGYTVEGQKTSQIKPSAFDRVNVRRLFLRLERLTYQVARYFVNEPNNQFTRKRLLDTLDPIFRQVLAQGGLYDYKLVCDESNNPGTVIDQGELHLLAMMKPVRTAEFIICTFVATRTNGSFDEIV
jgi:hypothetical protein